MLVTKNKYKKRRHIAGRGFVDSLKNVGSYIMNNKDLIAKPILGAVGSLGAMALTTGIPALINHIKNRHKTQINQKDPKYKEILQNLMPTTNIIGSGIKQF